MMGMVGGGGGTKASCLTCPENETIGYCVQRGELEIELFTTWTDVLQFQLVQCYIQKCDKQHALTLKHRNICISISNH